MQYPWGYAVPVRIFITRKSYPHYPWGYALPVSHILSTCESYPQYPWGYAVPVRIYSTRGEVSFILHSYKFTHGYWGYDSHVLRIWLTGTEDMTYGYCISSRVLRIWLTGTAYPHRYCISSLVLHIVYTGWNCIVRISLGSSILFHVHFLYLTYRLVMVIVCNWCTVDVWCLY